MCIMPRRCSIVNVRSYRVDGVRLTRRSFRRIGSLAPITAGEDGWLRTTWLRTFERDRCGLRRVRPAGVSPEKRVNTCVADLTHIERAHEVARSRLHAWEHLLWRTPSGRFFLNLDHAATIIWIHRMMCMWRCGYFLPDAGAWMLPLNARAVCSHMHLKMDILSSRAVKNPHTFDYEYSTSLRFLVTEIR